MNKKEDSDSLFEKRVKLIKQFGNEKGPKGITIKEMLTLDTIPYLPLVRPNISQLSYFLKNKRNGIKDALLFIYRKRNTLKRSREKISSKIIRGGTVFLPFSESQTRLFKTLMEGSPSKPCAILYDHSKKGIKRVMKSGNMNYIRLESYLDKKTKSKIKSNMKEIGKILRFLRKTSSKERYKKIKNSLDFYFGYRKKILEIIEFAHMLDTLLKKESPGAIIIPEDHSDQGKVASYICHINNIPCIHIQHGLYGNRLAFEPPTYCTRIAVYGEKTKEIYLRKGASSKKITMVGNPIYDVFAGKMSSDKKNEIKEKLNLPKDKKIILFSSQAQFFDRGEKNFAALFNLMKKRSDCFLIVDQHPTEQSFPEFKKGYLALAKKKGITVLVSNKNKDDLLRICDLFVTRSSTVLLAAMVNQKPIILTDLSKEDVGLDLTEFQAAIKVHTERELEREFSKLINNPLKLLKRQKKFIKKHLYKADGKSTERIIRLIEQCKRKS